MSFFAKLVFCNICGEKYFPEALPFHKKVCIKIWKATHIKCKYCQRPVHKDDQVEHFNICKTLPTEKRKQGYQKGSVVTFETIADMERNLADYRGRYACRLCGRRFTQDRINRHETICAKVKNNENFRRGKGLKSTASTITSGLSGGTMIGGTAGVTISNAQRINRPTSAVAKQASLKSSSSSSSSSKTGHKRPMTSAGKGVRIGGGGIAADEWRCKICSFLNGMENVVCRICQEAKHVKKEQAGEEQEEIKSEHASTVATSEDLAEDGFDEFTESFLDFLSELEIESGDGFVNCLARFKQFFCNIVKNPDEIKYRTLRFENPVFRNEVGKFKTAVDLLRLCGFKGVKKGELKHLVMKEVNIEQLETALIELDQYEEKMNQKELTFNEQLQLLEDSVDLKEHQQVLIPCRFCERKFLPDRVTKHEGICQKVVSQRPRKAYDGKVHRLRGTDFESSLRKKLPTPKRFGEYKTGKALADVLDNLKSARLENVTATFEVQIDIYE